MFKKILKFVDTLEYISGRQAACGKTPLPVESSNCEYTAQAKLKGKESSKGTYDRAKKFIRDVQIDAARVRMGTYSPGEQRVAAGVLRLLEAALYPSSRTTLKTTSLFPAHVGQKETNSKLSITQ